MILESLSGGLRKEVQELSLTCICGCGCLVPLTFWLEFCRHSWMIVPWTCKWSSPIGDMLCVWGFCHFSLSSLLPGLLLLPTQMSLENGLECRMGEKAQAELLAVGLRWRGWVGWTKVFLTHSYMKTKAIYSGESSETLCLNTSWFGNFWGEVGVTDKRNGGIFCSIVSAGLCQFQVNSGS